MEYGVHITNIREMPADPREVCTASLRPVLPPGPLRAIYFGAEFCADLLPDAAKAARFCAHARQTGVEAVLLTPVATPQGLATIRRLLVDLTATGEAPAVVFNDWGV